MDPHIVLPHGHRFRIYNHCLNGPLTAHLISPRLPSTFWWLIYFSLFFSINLFDICVQKVNVCVPRINISSENKRESNLAFRWFLGAYSHWPKAQNIKRTKDEIWGNFRFRFCCQSVWMGPGILNVLFTLSIGKGEQKSILSCPLTHSVNAPVCWQHRLYLRTVWTNLKCIICAL